MLNARSSLTPRFGPLFGLYLTHCQPHRRRVDAHWLPALAGLVILIALVIW